MNDIAQDGFAVVRQALTLAEREALADALGTVDGPGRRGLLGVPAVAAVAWSAKMLELVRPHVALAPRPVRCLYFDKGAGANWLVAWHQDLTLAMRDRGEAAGFGPWSVKGGVPHVQAPAECLEQMPTVRLHLDDADEANGALRVLAGSHRRGRLSAEEIERWRSAQPETMCCMAAGDALLMRPLLLHASSRSISGRRRRVVHIEYAGFELPAGLQWHEPA